MLGGFQDPPLLPTQTLLRSLGLRAQVGAATGFQDTVELVMALEEEFAIEIPDSEADKILSTADTVSYVAAHPMAK